MPYKIDRTDIELFRQARSGNMEAYGALIRGYQQRIFILCYSYLLDYHKAEDLTQETFVKFYKSIRRIRDSEKFYYYMLKIAKNLCINELKIKKREDIVSPIYNEGSTEEGKTIHDYAKPSEDTPESILIKRELCDLIHEKMKELNPDQRAVIYWVHFDGLSYEETSKILNCPIGSVRSRLSRGILRLGELLREYVK